MKLAANFSDSSASSSATTVGVSIARNIIDNTLVGGGRAPRSLGGTTLTANDGNINITANQHGDHHGDLRVGGGQRRRHDERQCGRFRRRRRGGDQHDRRRRHGDVAESTLTASTVDADTGAITVSATYGGSIKLDRRRACRGCAVGDGASDAVAIGAAVSLNLIGWRGTVADETEDSSAPITLAATVNGGSLTAGGLVSVTATSNAVISATTAAAAVAISVSTGGGSSSGKESSGGDSPTDADEEGEGATANAKGGESPTDTGEASGTTVDEGADNAGGAETNEGETSGAAAGEAGNTAGKEDGASQGSATSKSSGFGSGGGVLVGLGGVVSGATSGGSGSAPAPTFITDDKAATDAQSVNNGDTVQLASGYDTAKFSVGSGTTNTNSTVNPGDVVDDSGTLYRYVGPAALTGVDFEVGATPPDFTSTTDGAPNWIKIGGTGGHVYQYIGEKGGSLDLNNQDYTNARLWTDITGGNSSGRRRDDRRRRRATRRRSARGSRRCRAVPAPRRPMRPTKSPTDPSSASNPAEPATPTSARNRRPAKARRAKRARASASPRPASIPKTRSPRPSRRLSKTRRRSRPAPARWQGSSVTASDSARHHLARWRRRRLGRFLRRAASPTRSRSASASPVTRSRIRSTASVANAGQINAPDAPVTISAAKARISRRLRSPPRSRSARATRTPSRVAGGGSLADNLIGVETTATLSGTESASPATRSGALSVTAIGHFDDRRRSSPRPRRRFRSRARSATAVGIGASLAHNRIGDGTDTGDGAVTASISNSPIFAARSRSTRRRTRTSKPTVWRPRSRFPAAASLRPASPARAPSLSTKSRSTSARPSTAGPPTIIASTGVTVAAADTSTINATVFAGSVAGGFSSESANAVAIGVSFARNSITDPVTAYVENVPSLTTDGGAVSVTAMEGGDDRRDLGGGRDRRRRRRRKRRCGRRRRRARGQFHRRCGAERHQRLDDRRLRR